MSELKQYSKETIELSVTVSLEDLQKALCDVIINKDLLTEADALRTENEALKARVAEFEEATCWRKYPDEKPEKINQNILVTLKDNTILFLSFDDEYSNFDYHYDYMEDDVVSWMPIPEIGGE